MEKVVNKSDLARFRLQWALDPVLFARDVLGFECDPRQAAFLRSPANQIILLCTRQWGKSTVTAIMAVWLALFRRDSLILIFSHTDKQAINLFRKVKEFMKRCPGAFKEMEADNMHELEMSNGSRIVALPENPDGVRSFSAPAMIIVDEAAFVDPALFGAVTPMRATVPNSRMVWMSSPNGKRGNFYEAWTNGGDYWDRHHVPVTECPRITKAFVEDERRQYGDAYVRQEYMCEFLDALSSVFTHEQVMAAMATYDEPMITIK